jgi:hypothetical protein
MSVIEYIFNNYDIQNKTKKLSKKKSITNIKKKEDKLFNSDNNLYNFYKSYNFKNINENYSILNNIIKDNIDNEEKILIYTSGYMIYNPYYYFFSKINEIVMSGDNGINNFIDKIKDL